VTSHEIALILLRGVSLFATAVCDEVENRRWKRRYLGYWHEDFVAKDVDEMTLGIIALTWHCMRSHSSRMVKIMFHRSIQDFR
jgi:hypothetical protein